MRRPTEQQVIADIQTRCDDGRLSCDCPFCECTDVVVEVNPSAHRALVICGNCERKFVIRTDVR